MNSWKRFMGYATLLLSLTLAGAAHAADPYEKITPPQNTGSKDKIVINELFWYSCPHCFHFEAFVQPWKEKLPADVEFNYVPAVFGNGRFEHLAKGYYTAQALGMADTLHQAMFRSFHVDKKFLKDAEDIKALFVKNGVDPAKFDSVYNSFGVDGMVRKARQITTTSGATGVPVVLFNGKYRVSADTADGYDNMMKVLDDLIVKERAVMGLPALAAK